MMRESLKLLHGNGDLIKELEYALEKAREGVFVGAVICIVTAKREVGYGAGWRDDLPAPWALLLSALADAHYDLLKNGLPE